MKKIFSTLYIISVCLGVSVGIGLLVDIIFDTEPFGLIIFIILGAIAVYLINRGRTYGSADKSGPNTCSLCEGQGKVRSTKWFFSIERTCPTCNGEGYSNTTPKTEDKDKYEPIKSGGGFFETIGILALGAIIISAQHLVKHNRQYDPPLKYVPPLNMPALNLDGKDLSKLLSNKAIVTDGKKELYDFCEEEGFDTTDKGIKECGLLINKRLLDANIDSAQIDTSQDTEQVLNKLEEQGKIIKKMEQREKFKRFINVYKAYKKSGLF